MKRRIQKTASALAFCAATIGSAQAAGVITIDAVSARVGALSIAEDLAAPTVFTKQAMTKAPMSRKSPPETDLYLDYFDLAITPLKKGVQANYKAVDLREIIGGEERPEIVKAPEVPAPGALILMLTGLAAFAGFRRRA